MTFFSALPIVALLVACGADAAATGGAIVTGDDQNQTLAPCAPILTLQCRRGYHTIVKVDCPTGEGRCTLDACEPRALITCTDGYAPSPRHCKRVGGETLVRCTAADAGADDTTSPRSEDAAADEDR